MIVNNHGGDSREEDDVDVPSEVTATLKHGRRREVFRRLSEADGELSLVALANRVAATTDDTLPDVVIELHDVHLPVLIDCGLVEYDDDTGTVTLAHDSGDVETVLERL